jgi:2,3-bisphosphoglycerate-independent phosphoglycerate mutase
MAKNPVMLMILDGFGISNYEEVMQLKQLNILILLNMNEYPHTEIGASGFSVGLPNGQMGNSELDT